MTKIFKKTLESIKIWWKGKYIGGNENFTDLVIITPALYRHWTSQLIHNIFNFLKKEWKVVIPIILTILNFMYTYSIKQTTNKADEKYQSCKIQQDDKNIIAVICLK